MSFSDFKEDKSRMDNWRGFLNEQQERPDEKSSAPSLKDKRAWLEWHIQKSGVRNMGIALPRARKAYDAAIKKADGGMTEGHDCASHEGQTHEEWERGQLEEVYVDPDEPSQDSDDDLNELMRLIREEIEVVLSDAEAKEFFGDDALSSGNLQEQMDMGWLKQQIQNGIRDAKLQGEAAAKFEAAVLAKYGKRRFSRRRIHSWTKNIQLMARALQEENRTAKGNITQDTREKHATVGKDKFPIFDKKSADAAIDLRGHAPAGDRAKIIDKAAKFDPTAAKKARKADKKDKN
mgnify:CR=1 FL=1